MMSRFFPPFLSLSQPRQTVAELEEDERKAALAWKDDGRKGRVLLRRRERLALPRNTAAQR